MAENRFAEAQDDAAAEIARTAPADNPVNTIAVSAHDNTLYLAYNVLNTINRQSQEKEYLATLHLVDQSSIPFPDDQPIIYPPADVWRELTKAREKYRSVDLKEAGSAEAKIIKALDEPTEMDFVETPLKDVIDSLKSRHGIEIQLDTKALTDAGVTADTPITKSLKGISLRSALRLMLAEHELAYIIDHEVLLITTADVAKTKTVTKVYPVADLVLPINNSAGINPFQTGGGLGGQGGFNSGGNMMGQQGGFGGGGGGGGFGGGGFGGGGGGAFDVRRRLAAAAAQHVPTPRLLRQPLQFRPRLSRPKRPRSNWSRKARTLKQLGTAISLGFRFRSLIARTRTFASKPRLKCDSKTPRSARRPGK